LGKGRELKFVLERPSEDPEAVGESGARPGGSVRATS
jgi:hypothetical protein